MQKTEAGASAPVVYLLDASVLIALAVSDHSLYPRARTWFRSVERFATCPVTEGALLRFSLRILGKSSMGVGRRLLESFYALPSHVFWPDDLSYLHVPERGIYGHKQITDMYLAALAQAHGGILATMDEALASLHPASLLI